MWCPASAIAARAKPEHQAAPTECIAAIPAVGLVNVLASLLVSGSIDNLIVCVNSKTPMIACTVVVSNNQGKWIIGMQVGETVQSRRSSHLRFRRRCSGRPCVSITRTMASLARLEFPFAMNIRVSSRNVLLLFCLGSDMANADVLWTSALSIDGGNDLHCRITNVTARQQWVQAASHRADGSVVSRSEKVLLAPYGSAVLTNDDSSSGAVVCEFRVRGRSDVRASAQNTRAGMGAIAAMPAQ